MLRLLRDGVHCKRHTLRHRVWVRVRVRVVALLVFLRFCFVVERFCGRRDFAVGLGFIEAFEAAKGSREENKHHKGLVRKPAAPCGFAGCGRLVM